MSPNVATCMACVWASIAISNLSNALLRATAPHPELFAGANGPWFFLGLCVLNLGIVAMHIPSMRKKK